MLMAQLSNDTRDWSQLHSDLLVLIANRINLIEDYLNFGTVCRSWHSVATKGNFNCDLPRVPWLMLAEEEDDQDNSHRRFFSLYNGMILKKKIPKASGKRCMESMGWLITVGKDHGEINLLHPFSGFQIELPHQNTTKDYEEHETAYPFTFFRKVVLSASPSHTSDFVLMVIEGGMRFLSFWRPGDLRWTRISWEETSHASYYDVIHCNGLFYSIDYLGRVQVLNIAGAGPPKSHIVAQIPFCDEDVRDRLYILESLGSFFVVVRNGGELRFPKDNSEMIPLSFIRELGGEVDMTYGTKEFQVFHVNLATGKVTQTTDLGDQAFFVGQSSSLSIQASQFPGIKPNHIYFTDDYFESYLLYEEGGGSDMGVFSLADGSIQRHYKDDSLSRVCPPIWVTPTLR